MPSSFSLSLAFFFTFRLLTVRKIAKVASKLTENRNWYTFESIRNWKKPNRINSKGHHDFKMSITRLIIPTILTNRLTNTKTSLTQIRIRSCQQAASEEKEIQIWKVKPIDINIRSKLMIMTITTITTKKLQTIKCLTVTPNGRHVRSSVNSKIARTKIIKNWKRNSKWETKDSRQQGVQKKKKTNDQSHPGMKGSKIVNINNESLIWFSNNLN